jgi:biotin operon repressor
VPDVPDGYVPLAEAARRLGCARQTVLHKVQRCELDAIHVTTGQRKGLRIVTIQVGRHGEQDRGRLQGSLHA